MDNLNLKRGLTLDELGLLESEMLNKRKSKDAAWGLWAGLSFFGAHRFYTEDYAYASLMLLTSALPLMGIVLLGIYTDLSGFSRALLWASVAMLAGSVIWSWIDALFLNGRIERLNRDLEQQVIEKIKSGKNAL